MNFNHEAYQRRLDELKEDVRGLSDQLQGLDREVWHKDVSLRYGRFLAQRSVEQLQRATSMFAGYDHVDDKQKHRDYCGQELMGVVAGIHAAAALVRGAVLTSDPVGVEAMMRIYEEVNGPKAQTPAAPAAA